MKSTSYFHIIIATQTKPMPKRRKKIVSGISYSSSSSAVSFCLNENHIDNPIATNPITNNTSVTAIPKSTNNYPTMGVGLYNLSFQTITKNNLYLDVEN